MAEEMREWPQSRRRWLQRAAVASGVGLMAWGAWKGYKGHGEESQGQEAVAGDAIEALWRAQWPQPGGADVVMQSLRGQRVVVNFWASWCAPCVEEIPLLNGFYAQMRESGWHVVGVAADSMEAVQRFMARHPVDYPVAVATMEAIALSRSLGNLVGGLPFTLVMDSQGNVAQRKMGRLLDSDLQLWKLVK